MRISSYHDGGSRSFTTSNVRRRMMPSLCGVSFETVARNVVLANSTAKRGYDPGPFSANLVNEPGEEDDRACCFDDTVNASPQGIISQANGCEDSW